jgi:hypothetical protein
MEGKEKMNSFEQKQEEKRQYYAQKAVKMKKFADNYRNMQKEIIDRIPTGQPILVGHHSEKKHRRDLSRLHRYTNKAIEFDNKARYYEGKAVNYGKKGISSDDPDAIIKLKEKLKKLEDKQAHMKHVNRVHRVFIKNPATLDKANVSDSIKTAIRNYKPQYSWEKTLYPSYAMQNGNGNINSVKKRIASLEEVAGREDMKKDYDGFTYLEEDNRHQFVFDGKPEPEIRTILKKHAFKWSPTRGAWVRKQGGYARFAAENVIKALTVT